MGLGLAKPHFMHKDKLEQMSRSDLVEAYIELWEEQMRTQHVLTEQQEIIEDLETKWQHNPLNPTPWI